MSRRLDVWPPLPPLAHFRGRAETVPFPLNEGGVALFERARQGILVGVSTVGLAPGDEVLVPAYHHGSEIEALLQAGLVPRFYEATETLAPDEVVLDGLCGQRTRALYVIHYLGFPQDAARWRRFCDERSLLLLEDAAQAWLASDGGQPVGSYGDLAIFCLYKTFGLPDGAALIVRRGVAEQPAEAALGIDRLARRHATWAVGRSSLLGSLASALAREPRSDEAQEDFATGAVRAPSRLTTFLVPRLGADATAHRRAHYQLLLEDLNRDVPPPFAELPSGAAPFAFPVATLHKQQLVDRLERAGVRALDFWSIPHPALPATRFPAARERRATTVGLPVHQELRPVDIDLLARAVRGRPRTFRCRVEWFDDLEPLRAEWDRLAIESANVFATWEWASIWWRRYGDGKRLRVAACHDGTGRLFALLPLYEWRDRPMRFVRFLGHGTGDQLGPICSPRDRAAAARGLRQALCELRYDILLAEHLVAEEGWAALVGGGRVLRREGYPLIRCAGGWNTYLATRSRHFRRKIGWEERRLGREGDVRYRLGGSADALEDDMDTLFSLHRRRWAEKTDFSAAEGFHRELAARAGDRGWLRLWFLEFEGAPVAAWYGFRFAGTESHFQSGRDPDGGRSVGSVLLLHTIREALDDGIGEYRFLRGAEAYKYRFATEDPGLETLGFAAGPGSSAALLAARAGARLQFARSVARAALSP